MIEKHKKKWRRKRPTSGSTKKLTSQVTFGQNVTNALAVTGYPFTDPATNLFLVRCCGVPAESVLLGQLLVPQKNQQSGDSSEVTPTNSPPAIIIETQPQIAAIPNGNLPCVPLLFGEVILEHGNNILYSQGGIGKSLLSIEVAKNPRIKHPAFILREDYNGRQLENYRRLVGKNAMLFTVGDWKATESALSSKQKAGAKCEIYMQFTDPQYRKLQNITHQVYAKQGLKDGNGKHDEISVLESIAHRAIDEGADFICIDSLNAVVSGNTKLDRKTLERIVNIVAGKNVTLLVVHHANKKGQFFGSVEAFNTFDTVCKLERATEAAIAPGNDVLVLHEEKSRFGKRHTITFERAVMDDDMRYTVRDITPFEPTQQTTKPKNLNDKVIAALQQFDTPQITFADLFAVLNETGAITKGGLTNTLKQLEDYCVVAKADDKTWSTIINLQ